MPKIINLDQGSPYWLSWRNELGIGSSEAATIMGLNPWQTLEQLAKEKIRPSKKAPNEAMQRGTRLEPKARAAFELTIGRDFSPICMEDSSESSLRASLDGWDGTSALEIKCPGKESHLSAIKGMVPHHYYWQCQHILMISESNLLYYFSFDGVKGVTLEVHRNESDIQNLRKKELAFLSYLRGILPQKKSRPSSDGAQGSSAAL